MYFDFEDYHPDITPVGSVISWREGVLLSIIVHLLGVIAILVLPKYFPVDMDAVRARQEALLAERQPPENEQTRFVFVQPRIDTPAPTPPPPSAPRSDQDRVARAPERSPDPTNLEPLSRGNTPERVEQSVPEMARGRGPEPEPAAGPPAPPDVIAPPVAENELSALRLPEASSPLQLPGARPPAPPAGSQGRSPTAGGGLGAALQNLERYVQRDQFKNSQGGGAFGPAIQFDTKGVEFGPWVRRFIAQVKRNWEPLIPLSAMTQRGHTVVTFNVHKDGTISDIAVVGPSPINAFNTAAYGALASSNPTLPLPPEYPADRAFFTVTFFYNEEPQ